MEYRENNEISLKEIIAFITELKCIAYNNKYKILAFTFFISCTVLSINYFLPIKYEASAKLLLKERSGSNPFLAGLVGNITGVGNILGSVGEDAFINISQTKEVVKNTLIKDEEFRGEEDNLNNH